MLSMLVKNTLQNILPLVKFLLIVSSLVLTNIYTANSSSSDASQLIKDYGLRESKNAISNNSNWQPKSKIVVRVDSAERLEWIKSVVPGANIIGVSSYQQALQEAKDAHAIVGFCSEELIKAASQLAWIQIYSAGAERCVSQPLIDSGLTLTNAQRLSGPGIAEHAISLMTSLTRGLDIYFANRGHFTRPDALADPEAIWEINGRTLLVVGLGGIGTEIAKRAHGLGMKVIATRHSRRSGPDYVSYVGLSNELLTLAKQADVVINATPLTAETKGIFNKEFFKQMPNHAYFISIGRGKSTITEDLIEALHLGELAGAGLDVTDPEPLPEGHKLWTMPRVIITPHVAWRSDKYQARRWLMVRENIRRFAQGEELLSVVDPKRGY